MLPPPSAALSQRAVEETRAVDALEAEFAADLDFGGIQTAQCGQALSRASRGGLLSGAGLQAVATLLAGASKLQRAIKTAAREADATGYEGLLPVTAAFKVPACWAAACAPPARSVYVRGSPAHLLSTHCCCSRAGRCHAAGAGGRHWLGDRRERRGAGVGQRRGAARSHTRAHD